MLAFRIALHYEGMANNRNSLIYQTTFIVPAIDCLSEEQMIRMTLAPLSILTMEFDLPHRKLIICHGEDPNTVLSTALYLQNFLGWSKFIIFC